jgi:prepilin-type N-terminal cleavage/methylation domain-containing protein
MTGRSFFNSLTQNESAFSLLEVLVSMSLLSISLSAIYPATHSFMKHIHGMGLRTEAVAVAQQKFDELRQLTPDDLPDSGTDGPETYSGGEHDFDVYTTYCANALLCPSDRTRHIQVSVQYQGKELYHVDSVFTRLR